jgi:hypothetical protein
MRIRANVQPPVLVTGAGAGIGVIGRVVGLVLSTTV